jgi:putative Mg2+ transporter-C (MgtC) family protein
MNPDETEALYRVHVVCPSGMVSAARDLLFDELETHHYPIREMETLAEGETQVELAAILVPTTADPADLDAITAHIARHEGISSATWTVSATN